MSESIITPGMSVRRNVRWTTTRNGRVQGGSHMEYGTVQRVTDGAVRVIVNRKVAIWTLAETEADTDFGF